MQENRINFSVYRTNVDMNGIQTDKEETDKTNITTIHEEMSKECCKMPRINEKIRYRNEENDDWKYVQIIGRGGKSTGKNKITQIVSYSLVNCVHPGLG